MTEAWIEEDLAVPKACTDACAEFLMEHSESLEFINHVFRTAMFADTAFGKLKGQGSNKAGTTECSSFASITRVFLPLMAEMVWCRGVDNFLTYLSKLLGLVFRTRPETLRSAKTERLDVVLAFDSMSSLIDHLAEKRVHDLAYAGLGSLNQTLEREIGFELFPNRERMDRAVVIVETRNLIVHNRGVINDLYVSRTGDRSVPVGCKWQVGLPCAARCLRFLAAAVADIDSRARLKFALPSSALDEDIAKVVARSLSANDTPWFQLQSCASLGEPSDLTT